MFIVNAHQNAETALRPRLIEALGTAGRAKAYAVLSPCPRYAPTPLYELPGLARRSGIEALFVKDEGQRLGLKSFKALGGAYAVMTLVLDAAQRKFGRPVEASVLQSEAVRRVAHGITVACATDGNHGRSVAAGARIAGCQAVIFVHEGVSNARVEAISAQGARIVRSAGSYDDSVRECAERAAGQGWIVVSDTSWDGYEDIPLTVMQGYTIMAGEAFDAMASRPTHIFLQAGVGGMAAAVAAHASALYGGDLPKLVVVEPERAACLYASAVAGEAVEIAPGASTIMSMLECYKPSQLAWEILKPFASGFVTVSENSAIEAMSRFAHPAEGDPAIVAGESGGAGLAGLIACLDDASARDKLGLGSQSRVLLFNTEGATDPDRYRSLMASASASQAQQRELP